MGTSEDKQWEHQFRKMAHASRRLWIAGVSALLCLLVLLLVNQFAFSLELQGDEEIILEYGEAFRDPGAEPVMRWKLFGKEHILSGTDVSVSGYVNSGKPGKYELEYMASFLRWTDTCSRVVRIIDSQSPVIELIPDPPNAVAIGGIYLDAGVSAYDNCDGDITERVIRSEENGVITYAVFDSSGNPAYAYRQVPPAVYPPAKIELSGGTYTTAYVGEYREDPGYLAIDCQGRDISDRVEISGNVTWYKPGSYEVRYTVTDDFGNRTEVSRTVEIQRRERPDTVRLEGRIIYLTFDDGPGPDTERLLDVLDAYDAKATFFVTDSGYADTLKRIADVGHGIGIHTMTHDYQEIYKSPEVFFDDLFGMQKVIYEATGIKTNTMRFPGGSSNTVSRFNRGIMTTLTQAVADAGFRYYDWNVDSMDAAGAKTSDHVLKNVINGILNQETPIVLMHDIHSFSVDAVESILKWGCENGYLFLPIEENTPAFHFQVMN